MAIDFYTETGRVVNGLPTKVYFKAWATGDRKEPFDFEHASLKIQTKSGKKTIETTVIDKGISTIHQGMGSFVCTHENGITSVILQLVSDNKSIKRTVNFNLPKSAKEKTELAFTLMNHDKILDNQEDL